MISFTMLLLMQVAASTGPGAAVTNAATPKDKVICRQVQRSDSLLRPKKWCMSKAEWDKADREGNAKARAFDSQICSDRSLCTES